MHTPQSVGKNDDKLQTGERGMGGIWKFNCLNSYLLHYIICMPIRVYVGKKWVENPGVKPGVLKPGVLSRSQYYYQLRIPVSVEERMCIVITHCQSYNVLIE